MTLRVNGSDYDVAKTSHERIYLRTAVDLPPGNAELLISIDGSRTVSRIRLPQGASSDSQSVPTAALND